MPNEVATRVLALDAKATKGPWLEIGHYVTTRTWCRASMTPDHLDELATDRDRGRMITLLPCFDAPVASLIAEYRTAAPELARLVLRYERILEDIMATRNLVRRDEAGFDESLSMGEGAIEGSRECLDVSRAMLDTVLDSIESDMKGERSGDMDT